DLDRHDLILDQLVDHLVDLDRGEQQAHAEAFLQMRLDPIPVRVHLHRERRAQREEVERVHHADRHQLALGERRFDELNAFLVELDAEHGLVVAVERGARRVLDVDDETRLLLAVEQRLAVWPAPAPEDDQPYAAALEHDRREDRILPQPVDPLQLARDRIDALRLEAEVHLEGQQPAVAGAAAKLQELQLRNVDARLRVEQRRQVRRRGQIVELPLARMVGEDGRALDEMEGRLQKQHARSSVRDTRERGYAAASRMSALSRVAAGPTVRCSPPDR